MDKLKILQPKEISLSKEHHNKIIKHAIEGDPLEVCGLIGGMNNESKKIFPITNINNSPTSFRMDPQEQLDALLDIENNNFDLLAIYHSHPNGPDHPSAKDMAEANYPSTTNIIISAHKGSWNTRGFLINNNKYHEVKILIRNY